MSNINKWIQEEATSLDTQNAITDKERLRTSLLSRTMDELYSEYTCHFTQEHDFKNYCTTAQTIYSLNFIDFLILKLLSKQCVIL